jgi:hypothetical protein
MVELRCSYFIIVAMISAATAVVGGDGGGRIDAAVSMSISVQVFVEV